MQYDIGAPSHTDFRGIVIRNSGTGNTEIFKNTIGATNIDLQSLGTNKAVNELTGLKFICNSLEGAQVPEYNITVMKDIAPNTNNGISRYQYEPAYMGSFEKAAGNKFGLFSTPPASPFNYYLETGTNNNSAFMYKYSTTNPFGNPLARNFLGVSTSNLNLCTRIVIEPMEAPFSFSYFVEHLGAIEQEIDNIENDYNREAVDTLMLQSLYAQQSYLIDSIVNYYQAVNQTDSIALVYEQVTKGYHYQVYLSFAYRDLGRYDEAINLLNDLSTTYWLSEEEETQIEHLATIYSTQKWLKNNQNNWAELPEELKAPVYEFEQGDRMYAGAIAKMILLEHEGRIYPPVYRMPAEAVQPMSALVEIKGNKIYPNPIEDYLIVQYTENDNSKLIIMDITGRIVLQKNISSGYSRIETSRLMPGVYIAQIKVQGRTAYQQKIVKQ